MADAIALQDVTVTIDGIEITGWSDDSDCLMQPQANEAVNKKIGALGDVLYTSNPNRRGAPLTIKLLASSPAVPQLQRRAEAWRDNDVLIFDGSIANRRTGERQQLLEGTFETYPRGTTYGAGEVANMEYSLFFEDYIGNFDSVVYGR